jgi:hypothetical protein
MAMFTRGLMLIFVLLLTFSVSAQWAPAGDVPAFHAAPPSAGIPPVLTREQLAEQGLTDPLQVHAYELAAKSSKVIYQQPCYCHCDRSQGHKSLHSCFENTHGAMCSVCMAEVFYSYQMSKQHKSAAEIRKGIVAGDYKKIDLQNAASIN